MDKPIPPQEKGALPPLPRQRLLGNSSLSTPVAGMRSIWGLISSYWKSDDKKTAWLLTGALAGATVANIAVDAALGYTVANITNSFVARQFDTNLAINLGLLFGSPIVGEYVMAAKVYYGNRVHMEWRRWMTEKFEAAKKMGNAMYHVRQLPGNVDHPDQAMTQGPDEVAGRITGLGTGLFTSVITLGTFTGVLASLCEKMPVEILGKQYDVVGPHFWYGMGAAVVLGAIQTKMFQHFGKAFDHLNLRQTRKEGSLRTEQLTTFNESAKITAYGAGAVNAHGVKTVFKDVMDNLQDIANTRRRYTFVTGIFNKTSEYAYLAAGGYLYAATRYTWGHGAQITKAVFTLQSSFAWFGASKPALSEAESWAIRMVELAKRLEEAQDPHTFYAQNGNRADIQINDHNRSSLHFKNIVIDNPKTGEPLLHVPDLEIKQGERIMVIGKSGTGKSCLLRIPFEQFYYGTGECLRPQGKKIVLAEPHILDSGTLRANLAFPESPETYSDAQYRHALKQADLSHLVVDLEIEKLKAMMSEEEQAKIERRSYSKLSNGEKQRLICARLLLTKPDVIILDEGFSAMDPALQKKMCRRLVAQLPNATIVVVVHAGNEKLRALFTKVIEVKDGELEVRQTEILDPKPLPFRKPPLTELRLLH